MSILRTTSKEQADRIMSGDCRWDLIRSTPTKLLTGGRVYLYVGSPVGGVVGRYTAGRIVSGSVDEVWAEVEEKAGVSERDFRELCGDSQKASAVEVWWPIRFETTMGVKATTGKRRAGPVFVYVDNENELPDSIVAGWRVEHE